MNAKHLTSAIGMALIAHANAFSLTYNNPVAPEFPILAWYSILPDSAQTPQRYAELREAGFNISFSHFKTNEEIDRALDAAKGLGVKLMLTSFPLYNDTKATVTRFRDNPGVAGWFLRDEPTTAGFKDLAAYRDRITDADTTHLLYLNLFPIMVSPKDLGADSYEDYMQRYLDEVRMPLISYDFYPIVRDDSTGNIYAREDHFLNLEIARKVAKRNGRPFWAFCLATAHTPYPIPTAAHLRFEAFTALAYGAQGIQYFTYWQPLSMQWNFHNAPIDETGRRTDVYYLVKELNREIQALAPVFLNAEIDDVSYVGDKIPAGTKHLEQLPDGFGDISTDGNSLLVSRFHNGDRHFLMLVNHDIKHAQTVNLNRPANVLRIDSNGAAVPDFASDNITLAPGDYYLIQYQ